MHQSIHTSTWLNHSLEPAVVKKEVGLKQNTMHTNE